MAVKVRYSKDETGWISRPIAVNSKGKESISIALNSPITTRKFRWGNLVLVKSGRVIRKISSIPNKKEWRLNKVI